MPRTGFILKVKKEKLEEYKARHKEVWPEMLDALRQTGWRNYSLFLRPDGSLFGYVEVDDFDAAREAMSSYDVNSRWQQQMSAFFEDIDGTAPDSAMIKLEEVFHLD